MQDDQSDRTRRRKAVACPGQPIAQPCAFFPAALFGPPLSNPAFPSPCPATMDPWMTKSMISTYAMPEPTFVVFDSRLRSPLHPPPLGRCCSCSCWFNGTRIAVADARGLIAPPTPFFIARIITHLRARVVVSAKIPLQVSFDRDLIDWLIDWSAAETTRCRCGWLRLLDREAKLGHSLMHPFSAVVRDLNFLTLRAQNYRSTQSRQVLSRAVILWRRIGGHDVSELSSVLCRLLCPRPIGRRHALSDDARLTSVCLPVWRLTSVFIVVYIRTRYGEIRRFKTLGTISCRCVFSVIKINSSRPENDYWGETVWGTENRRGGSFTMQAGRQACNNNNRCWVLIALHSAERQRVTGM